MLQDAEATICDLQGKPTATNQAPLAIKASWVPCVTSASASMIPLLVTEVISAPTIQGGTAPEDTGCGELAQAITTPLTMPQPSTDHEEAVVPAMHKPSGNTRKLPMVAEVQAMRNLSNGGSRVGRNGSARQR
jgi:hypothetical protein